MSEPMTNADRRMVAAILPVLLEKRRAIAEAIAGIEAMQRIEAVARLSEGIAEELRWRSGRADAATTTGEATDG